MGYLMGQVEDFLAANATVKCMFNARITERGCRRYQERNPDMCSGCKECLGGGVRPRVGPPLSGPRYYFTEVEPMTGVADLFKAPIRIAKKSVNIPLRIEFNDRIDEIADNTGHTKEVVFDAIIAEGLRVYDEAGTKTEEGKK